MMLSGVMNPAGHTTLHDVGCCGVSPQLSAQAPARDDSSGLDWLDLWTFSTLNGGGPHQTWPQSPLVSKNTIMEPTFSQQVKI